MADHPPPADPWLVDAFDRLPDAQRERVAQMAEAMLTRQAAPSMKLTSKDGVLEIGLKSDDLEIATLLQMADMGTTDADFHKGLVGQIASWRHISEGWTARTPTS